MPVTWNYDNAAHLLRRTCFGGTPSQITAFLNSFSTVDDAVADLLSFPVKKSKPPGPNTVDDTNRLKLQRWWLKRMIHAPTHRDACREKLALYWHNHLCSGSNKQPTLRYMSLQNKLLRANARGNFKNLVREFNRDAANLYYLDGILNYASTDGDHDPPYATPNENWGRELMELFTLGVFQLKSDGSPDPSKPNYTENDVHQLARACTGWTEIQANKGVWHDYDWDGGQYDDNQDGSPDDVVIFGVTNNNFRIDDAVAGTADDVIELIFSRTDDASNNQVAMFVVKKLWTWYAYPPPETGLKSVFASLASTFVTNNFEMTPLLQAMWTHPLFYSNAAKSRTVKNPCDYVVQALRSFGVKKSNAKYIGDANEELGDTVALMGMNLFEPPNVAGWPGGLNWINSGTLLTRAEFAKNLAMTDYGSNNLKLSSIEGLPLGNPAASPGVVVDAIIHQLGLDIGPTPITTNQRNALIAYATSGGPTLDLSDAFTGDATTKVRGLISLAIQTAENQVF